MKLVKRAEIPNESASESPNDTVSSANAEPIPHQKIDLQTIQHSNFNNNKIDNYWDHHPLHGMNYHSSGPQFTKRHQRVQFQPGSKSPNDTATTTNEEFIPHQKISPQTIQYSNFNNNNINNYWDTFRYRE